MKSLLFLYFSLVTAGAQLVVDVEAFGKELGGWDSKGKKAADYSMSDADYRTFKPVVTETPRGGRFISIRIDNRRGFLSSDDHALLQVSLDGKGTLLALESSIHAQGKSIKSDVVLTTGKEAAAILGGDVMLNAGLKLAKDLSAKLAGEAKVEAGRVVFPAVIVHNYNKLMKCVSYVEPAPKAEIVEALPVPSGQAVEKPAEEQPAVKSEVLVGE
ncbi:hypothetical protein V2O64_11270 [Verrucomicrobiaceae bacterium 227]